MRILRIQFENLNPLPSGVLDLENGLLAEPACLALSAEGEACQSPLFNAATLALYGRTQEKELDRENCLTPGAVSCRAAVLFEVPGGRYQACWELRRAQDKPEGKLQPALHILTEEGTGRVLARDEADTLRFIEELTGLDYAQFLHWVSQQDELARFLNVKREDREGTTPAAHPSDTLAKLLKGRTVEDVFAESAKLDQKQSVLVALRAAMEKRDHAAAESSRLADEEAQLEEEIATATQEKATMLLEAEAQAAILESARSYLETPPSPEEIPSLDEARRNFHAAQTASDTATREARVAADALTRLENRLAEVRKRRGEMRWQQTAYHEAVENAARTIRVFTPEALAEAFADLENQRTTQEKLLKAIQEAHSA